MRSPSGHLLVLEELGKRVVSPGFRHSFVRVQCDCGRVVELVASLMSRQMTCGGADCEHANAAREASRQAYRAQLHFAPPKARAERKLETPAVLLAPLPKRPPMRTS
jgi:hypothetical protein